MRRRRWVLGFGALLLAGSANAQSPQEYPLSELSTLATAAAQNKAEDVTVMLRRGDNPNILDSAGRSPLGYAAAFGNTAMAKALLDGGARLDFRDRFGNTPLHWAAENRQVEMLHQLLAAKAPVDTTNRQGITPLMLAAGSNATEVVRALLAAGADPRKQDFTGRDALGWAQGKPGALRMLQQAAK